MGWFNHQPCSSKGGFDSHWCTPSWFGCSGDEGATGLLGWMSGYGIGQQHVTTRIFLLEQKPWVVICWLCCYRVLIILGTYHFGWWYTNTANFGLVSFFWYIQACRTNISPDTKACLKMIFDFPFFVKDMLVWWRVYKDPYQNLENPV